MVPTTQVVGSLDFVLQLRAEEGMDTVLQSLVLLLGTERTLRDLKDLKTFIHQMCVYRKEYLRIYTWQVLLYLKAWFLALSKAMPP